MADPLDSILKNRAVPRAPGNLAARIIEDSKRASPQKQGLQIPPFFKLWMAAVKDNFVMPRPAIAMMTLMLMGVYFGFALEEASMQEEDLPVLYIEETMDFGDWL